MASNNPAEIFESYMVPSLFAPWAEELVHRAQPRAGERVLDVACGTGIVARCVAPTIGPRGKVVGLDLNPGMLAVASSAATREGAAIELHEGRAEALPFPDGSFDLVVCQQGLQFFADQPAALAEMRRVLTEDGRATLSVWQAIDRHPFYQTLDDVLLQRFGMAAAYEIFSLGDAEKLGTLLSDAGFQHVEIEGLSIPARFPDPEWFIAMEIEMDTAAIPSMQHLTAEERRAMVAEIRDDMEAALRNVTEGDHVVIPFHAYIARAQA